MQPDPQPSNNGVPKEYRLPRNISLPPIYNWNSYDGLPVYSTDKLTWTSFPAGEPTAFLISAATKEQINNPTLNGNSVPRPADINGNPVDINVVSSSKSDRLFDVAVSLVPQNTGPTPHSHWSDYEWFYVLAGSITLYVSHDEIPNGGIPGVDGVPLADRLYEVKVDAGQMVYGPANMIHSFTNYSEEPAVWLTIWRRDQNELTGGISSFFTRGDIAPLVKDYDASVDFFEKSDFFARVSHWAKTFPLYNVTISETFGTYIKNGQFDPNHPNQPGPNNPDVIKGAPQEVLDANSAQELNSLFQGHQDLLVTAIAGTTSVEIRSASGMRDLPTNLEVSSGNSTANGDRYGYYLVDNANGDINGISIRDNNYVEAAQKRIVPLFASSLNSDHNSAIGSRTIAVKTGEFLAFSKIDGKGNLTLSTIAPDAFDLINSAGSWKSDLYDATINVRLKGPIATLDDTISGHNNNFQQPLLDTRPLEKRESQIYSSSTATAADRSNYKIGYYEIVSPDGSVADAEGRIYLPGDSLYGSVALRQENLPSDLNSSLNKALDSGEPIEEPFTAGKLYAPFVILEDAKTNGEITYFSFDPANPDGISHIASIGRNSFGFRRSTATPGYDDVRVIQSFSLTPRSTQEPMALMMEQSIEIQNFGFNAGSLAFYLTNKDNGNINGLKPTDPGYTEAAYQWAKDNNTIIYYNQLPELNDSKTFTDLGLQEDLNYGLLYVADPAPSADSLSKFSATNFVSSYASANPGSKQYFAAYSAIDGSYAYGLETGENGSEAFTPTYNDLYITSNVDNITVWYTVMDPATLYLSALSADKAEGNIGSTPFTFTIQRDGDPSAAVSVAWSVTGSGTNPADALDFAGSAFPSGVANLAAGQTSQQITLNVVGDGSFEADETFTLSLSNPLGGSIVPGADTAYGRIQNDDVLSAPVYTFSKSADAVDEGSSLAIGISTSNAPVGSPLYWRFGGTDITAADFSDGLLEGSTVLGSDGRAGFSKAIATDPDSNPNETLELRFFRDAARTQQIGSTVSVLLRQPSVGLVTDASDILTGTSADESLRGVPTGSTLRGKGSLDRLTGGGGNDQFVLGDAIGRFYDDGTPGLGSADLALITDFTSDDRIQLHGLATDYRLISGRYAGVSGVRIDALSPTPEAIGFVQGSTLASLSLANTSQFVFV